MNAPFGHFNKHLMLTSMTRSSIQAPQPRNHRPELSAQRDERHGTQVLRIAIRRPPQRHPANLPNHHLPSHPHCTTKSKTLITNTIKNKEKKKKKSMEKPASGWSSQRSKNSSALPPKIARVALSKQITINTLSDVAMEIWRVVVDLDQR